MIWGGAEYWRKRQEEMSSTPETEPEPNKEMLKVLQWRRIYLEKAGYDPEAATLIAESPTDLHKAAALLENGCDATTALRILL